MGMYISQVNAGAPEAGIVGVGDWLADALQRRAAIRAARAKKRRPAPTLTRRAKLAQLRAAFLRDAPRNPVQAFVTMYHGLPVFTTDRAAFGSVDQQLRAAAMQIGQMFAKSIYTDNVSKLARAAGVKQSFWGSNKLYNDWTTVRSWILSAVALRAEIRRLRVKT